MNAGNIMGDIEPMKPVRHNPTEQFILLAKGTRGAACCDLIKTVLEAPGVYVFAELLELTNVKDVSDQLKLMMVVIKLHTACVKFSVGEYTERQISTYTEFICIWYIQRLCDKS